MRRWFGPLGFAVFECEMDAPEGGRWRVGMTAPEGTQHVELGTVRELVPDERLMLTHAWLRDEHRSRRSRNPNRKSPTLEREQFDARRVLRAVAVSLALGLAACSSSVTPVLGCNAADGIEPVCDFRNPEDIVGGAAGRLAAGEPDGGSGRQSGRQHRRVSTRQRPHRSAVSGRRVRRRARLGRPGLPAAVDRAVRAARHRHRTARGRRAKSCWSSITAAASRSSISRRTQRRGVGVALARLCRRRRITRSSTTWWRAATAASGPPT